MQASVCCARLSVLHLCAYVCETKRALDFTTEKFDGCKWAGKGEGVVGAKKEVINMKQKTKQYIVSKRNKQQHNRKKRRAREKKREKFIVA